MQNPLYSKYLLDGLEMDATPAQILSECSEKPLPEVECSGVIADESLDPAPTPSTFRSALVAEYISKISSLKKNRFPLQYARSEAKAIAAQALIDAIWQDGHFLLGNLRLNAFWTWNDEKVGNMAAFYDSVDAMSEYIGELGVRFLSVSVESGECSLSLSTEVSTSKTFDEDEDENIIPGRALSCPPQVVDDPKSWIIYIPFDTCPYRLGGSALSVFAGNGSDNAPDIQDTDYFIDCYEVVREMVEDGVVLSGVTVGRGGLMGAASQLCSKTGLTLDISGISSSCGENKSERILFGEIPGVLIQVRDNDFDYIDSQFLLEDIAYYPLGHPCGNKGEIKVVNTRKPAIASILGALLNQAEGED